MGGGRSPLPGFSLETLDEAQAGCSPGQTAGDRQILNARTLPSVAFGVSCALARSTMNCRRRRTIVGTVVYGRSRRTGPEAG
ncbi:hypothetical protein ACNKHO_14385 [Shigella flexneri]